MQPSVRRPQKNVCHRSDGAEQLIASDGYRYQQKTVHVIDHFIVEPEVPGK